MRIRIRIRNPASHHCCSVDLQSQPVSGWQVYCSKCQQLAEKRSFSWSQACMMLRPQIEWVRNTASGSACHCHWLKPSLTIHYVFSCDNFVCLHHVCLVAPLLKSEKAYFLQSLVISVAFKSTNHFHFPFWTSSRTSLSPSSQICTAILLPPYRFFRIHSFFLY